MTTTTDQPTLSAQVAEPVSATAIPATTEAPRHESTFKVIRRNNKKTAFDASKISLAMTKAFLAVEGGQGAASARIRELVNQLTDQVVHALTRRMPEGGILHIEDIQDQVELALMRQGEQKVARSYVIYREQRTREREQEIKEGSEQPGSVSPDQQSQTVVRITQADGSYAPLDTARLHALIEDACDGLEDVDAGRIYEDTRHNFFDGISSADVSAALVMSARTLTEQEPNYSLVAARLLLDSLRSEALGLIYQQPMQLTEKEMAQQYAHYFEKYIDCAVKHGILDERLAQFDLVKLGQALCPQRDQNFTYLGLRTLYDRYFIHRDEIRFELPQAFFMRVAMGLAINEPEREQRAEEFYHLLSSFDFMSSTPTLFNSGTLRPQLSSCYLTTVPDDLEGIFSSIRDDALLSKFAGGLGNDWSQVRALGAYIEGTNGNSQGVVPFLKVANDTAVAVNQGGKRKGAICAYLETWHLDIEEFLELRKNTGDERRRTHDMNTANWVPDLFMKRVAAEEEWTLFSPDEVTDLHDLYGKEFEQRYIEYEALAAAGKIRLHKTVSAVELWRKMLSMLFETGHPWITFKDPCNLRSPQAHRGVVHSSNLCTEITLNTSNEEVAVCNLGSINLAQHVGEDGLLIEKLQSTITTAMRMLDNVIDYNYYSIPTARNSNLRHRPVGLGIMGFQDALYAQRIAYASDEAVEFADSCMETISYFAIQASTLLAEERGCYSSYPGSLWSQGILPIDSLQQLAEHRMDEANEEISYLQVDTTQRMDWEGLRTRVKEIGMRNSNCLAIAPTATISNICGVTQSIEPTYQNLFVKSNLSGEFTVINPWLVRDLKERELWDEVMVNDLKYFDGSLQNIDRIPDDVKALYASAFEIDPRWLVEAASRRQKWIDQSQSLNLYMAEPSGKKLDNLYKLAWVRGLKTTYYLRSLGATHMEKSIVENGALPQSDIAQASACSITDPDCEACQ